MLLDAARYQTLMDQQQQEARKFRDAQSAIYEEHTEQVNNKQQNHQSDMYRENELIGLLQENIRTMQRDNEEMMDQIIKDSDGETTLIRKKFSDNEEKVVQMTTTSKGEVQLTKNKLSDVEKELETLKRQISDKRTQLDKQQKNVEKLSLEQKEKKTEIDLNLF